MKIKTARWLVGILWLIAAGWLILSRPGPMPADAIPAGAGPDGASLFWFKGNTHAHSKIRLGDWTHGDSDPVQVASWYHDHGYHFLALTDHNQWHDGSVSAQLADRRGDFIVLPAMEITSDHRYPGVTQEGQRKIHSTALGVRAAPAWDIEANGVSDIIDSHVERTALSGGIAILNHPNYRFQVTAEMIEPSALTLMEIFNDHPRANQDGHDGFRVSSEALWDQLLSSGKRVFGVAADDAHDFGIPMRLLRRFGTAPPGGAWIMVRAPQLTTMDIVSAIASGDFYSTTGVILSNVSVADGRYAVSVDLDRTRQEIKRSWVRKSAPVVFSDDTHLVIEFIGTDGRLLHWTHDQDEADFAPGPGESYVRARITYLDKIPSVTGADNARQYRAWTQPFMTGDLLGSAD